MRGEEDGEDVVDDEDTDGGALADIASGDDEVDGDVDDDVGGVVGGDCRNRFALVQLTATMQ